MICLTYWGLNLRLQSWQYTLFVFEHIFLYVIRGLWRLLISYFHDFRVPTRLWLLFQCIVCVIDLFELLLLVLTCHSVKLILCFGSTSLRIWPLYTNQMLITVHGYGDCFLDRTLLHTIM